MRRTITVFRALGPIDMRNIRRDSLLGWVIFMPLFTAVFVRFLIPPFTDWLLAEFAFDFVPYYPLLLSYMFVGLVPLIFGMLMGMLLLDERDDNTLTALLVTPMSLTDYVIYRISVPMLIGVFMTMISFPIANLAQPPFWSMLLIAVAAAPVGPIIALTLATFAENKVAGFALMKGLSTIIVIPVAAWFIKSDWQLLAGILPTYWPLKAFWLMNEGVPTFWVFALIGIVQYSVIIWLFVRRFDAIMRR